MPKKSNKDKCGGTWSLSRYFTFIRSALRKAWLKYPVRYQALINARRGYTGWDKRAKFEYQCNKCKEWFKQKDVQVDHIDPAGSLLEYEDLPGFCKRLFCELKDLQVLCKNCHDKKTKSERKKK